MNQSQSQHDSATRSFLSSSSISTTLQPQSKVLFNQFFAKQRSSLSAITDNTFNQLFNYFESHKLFIMYEDLLDCDPLTDHKVPKNVLPVFYEAILEVKNTINIKLAISIMQNFENTIFDMFQLEKIYSAQLELQNLEQVLKNSQQAELSSKMQEVISSKLEYIQMLKNKRRIEDSQLAEQIFQMKKSTLYVPDIEVDESFSKKSLIAEEDLTMAQYKKQNKALKNDNQNLRIIIEKQNSQIKEQGFSSEQLQQMIDKQKQDAIEAKEKLNQILAVQEAKSSGMEKSNEQYMLLKVENENLRFKIAQSMKGCDQYEVEFGAPEKVISKLKQEIQSLKEQLIKSRQNVLNTNIVDLNKGQILSKDSIFNKENEQLKQQLKNIKQQIQKEFGVDIDQLLDKNGLSEDNSQINQLLLELAKQDSKYFGLSDADILKKMKMNGDLNKFMKTLEETNFLSQKDINKLIIEQYRQDHPELSHLTDEQIIQKLKDSNQYNKYLQQVKDNDFLDQKSIDKLIAEQARKDCKFFGMSDIEILSKLKEDNLYSQFKNIVKQNGFLSEEQINQKIIQLAKGDKNYQGLTDAQILEKMKQNGDFDKFKQAAITSHQNRAKNHLFANSKLKQKVSSDINSALQAAKGIQDVADALSTMQKHQGARDVGIQVQTRLPQTQKTATQNLAKVTKFQYFNDENDYIQIEDLNTERILQTTLQNDKFSFLKHFMSQRLSIDDVYQRLYQDAELNKSRLEQIKDLYFHNFKAPDQLLDPTKTMIITYLNDQFDRIRYAIQFSEVVKQRQPQETNRQMSSSTFQRPKSRGEISQFQFNLTGSKFVLKPGVQAQQEAYRIARPMSQIGVKRAENSQFGFSSKVEFNKTNSLLLSGGK